MIILAILSLPIAKNLSVAHLVMLWPIHHPISHRQNLLRMEKKQLAWEGEGSGNLDLGGLEGLGEKCTIFG